MPTRFIFLAFLLGILTTYRVADAQGDRPGPPPNLLKPMPPTPKFTDPQPGIIPNALVQKDADTKQIRRVRGHIPILGARTPREAAEKFLRAHQKTLGLSANLAELRPVREVESLTGFHLTYQQVYSNLPVFGGQLSVHTDKNLAIKLLNHDLIPVSTNYTKDTKKKQEIIRAIRGRDPKPAIEAAVQAVNSASGPTEAPKAEAGVLVEKGVPQVVWRVTFSTRSPGAAWMVMVNAQTNQVISVENIAEYFRPQKEEKR